MKNNIIITLIFCLATISSYSSNCVESSQNLFKSGKYKQSIKLINTCLEDAIDSKDNNLLSEYYYGLGINYFHIGELDSALKNYLISEFTLLNVDNFKFKAILFNELAITYIDKGLNHKAIYYLKKSVALNIGLDRKKSLIRNYTNLGHSFSNLSMLDSAIYYYNKVINIPSLDNRFTASTLNNISSIYYKKSKYKESVSFLLKSLNTDGINLNDSLLYKSNYDLCLITDGKKPIFNVGNEYIKMSESIGELKSADAYFKASIYEIYNGNIDRAINYLNHTNSIYVSNNNINKAKEISGIFIKVLRSYWNGDLSSITKMYEELEDKERVQYSNLLLKETDLKIETENSIILLNEKINRANINIGLLITLIVCLIVLIPVVIRYIIVQKLVIRLNQVQLDFGNDLMELHEKGIKNNLGKMISMMVISKRFKEDDIFVEIMDEIVKDSNKLSRVINNNKLIRSKNANTTTTNKLPMGR